MDSRNTIVIERNIYTDEVKYFWKDNIKNALTDLSENINSPFSRTRPDYKKFSTGPLKETAYEVVKSIDETYNRWEMDLLIEINGAEEDYLAIKNAMEDFFSGRGMDCTWSGHAQSSAEIMPKIEKVYRDLGKALSEYDEVFKLSDTNDEMGFLRSGFNRKNIVNERALYHLCVGPDAYLLKGAAQIKAETDRNNREIRNLQKKWEQSRLQNAKESPVSEEAVDIDMLSKALKKLCRKYTRTIGREFESLLKDSIEKRYLDETRITKLVRDAENATDIHRSVWRKSPSGDSLTAQSLDEESRRKYIVKMLVDCLNKDIRQYTTEVNYEGIHFGNKSAEELKKKFLEEIYASKELTEGQKDTVRQWVFGAEHVEVPYYTLKPEDQMDEGQFRWTRRTFEEKDICREYKRRLGKALRDKRNDVLNGNSKIFEKWGDNFFEVWKQQDFNAQSDRLKNEKQLREKLAFFQEKNKKLARLQNLFQESIKQIEALFSFKKS